MGSPGDHPLTDLFHWGRRGFPDDIADMLLLLHELDPKVCDKFALEAWDWSNGRQLEAGRATLRAELQQQRSRMASLAERIDRFFGATAAQPAQSTSDWRFWRR